jgi:hypothetical protein
MTAVCSATQVNRRVPDFTCRLAPGHGTKHEDPATGIIWGWPETTYGTRRAPRMNGARKPTKAGHYWSARSAGVASGKAFPRHLMAERWTYNQRRGIHDDTA